MSNFHLDRIDLVKIDVEGYEHIIFQSSLEWLEKVDHLLIEMHSEIDQDICIAALKSKGFRVTRLDPGASGLENIYWACRKLEMGHPTT